MAKRKRNYSALWRKREKQKQSKLRASLVRLDSWVPKKEPETVLYINKHGSALEYARKHEEMRKLREAI